MDGNDQDLIFPVFLWAVVPWAPSGTVGSVALAEGSAAPAPAASTGDAGLGGDGNFLPEQQALYFSLLPLPGNFLSLLKALGSVQLRCPASSAAQGCSQQSARQMGAHRLTLSSTSPSLLPS